MPLNFRNSNYFITVSPSGSTEDIYNLSQNCTWGLVEKIATSVDAVIVGDNILFNSTDAASIRESGNQYYIIDQKAVLLIEESL